MMMMQCPQVLCLIACPNGFQRDRNGCQTCNCTRGEYLCSHCNVLPVLQPLTLPGEGSLQDTVVHVLQYKLQNSMCLPYIALMAVVAGGRTGPADLMAARPMLAVWHLNS